MTDFLLELRSEEIPARMQAKASDDLVRLLGERLDAAALSPDAIEAYVTPRRLAVIVRGLADATEAQSEEIKGPRTAAPKQALEGFLRKTGLKQKQLENRDGIWFAVLDTPGRATKDVLAEIVPAIADGFPWPKSMRWGAASTSNASPRWVRPLKGVVAIFGDDLVACEVAAIASGYETLGHRFHHPGPITIGGADDYAAKLRACHVIVDATERRDIVRDGAQRLAAEKGLNWIADEALVAENAGLTEWPVPLIGAFDPDFLSVPREVIRLTLATNQKYFVLNDRKGALAPAFICVANIEANDGGAAILDGNRKVLAARLSDARHFWDQDRKRSLADHAEGLERITFHEKLGSVADKTARVEKLARWLFAEGIIGEPGPERLVFAAYAEQAAGLAKADLVTEMVGEFPELQGVIGGYYARAEGLPDQVAEAIADQYKPAGQGDDLPRDLVAVAVALADKLDTLASFFTIDEKPTGSRDPFALRRAALGVIRIITEKELRVPLRDMLIVAGIHVQLSLLGALDTATYPDLLDKDEGDHDISAEVRSFTYRYGTRVAVRWDSERTPNLERGKIIQAVEGTERQLLDFFADRLKVQQREAGVRHDLIDAVFAARNLGRRREYDLVRLLARVAALQEFVASEDGTDLLAGYKRATNILKKEGFGDSEPPRKKHGYDPEAAEAALVTALDAAEPRARAAIESEAFGDAMAALASLRKPIDRFFDEVTVNDDNPEKRETRLGLLGRIRGAVHAVADFSKIEG